MHSTLDKSFYCKMIMYCTFYSVVYNVLCFVMMPVDSFIRIVGEYETFKECASKVPDDSKEMMELIEYIEDARTNLVTDLKVSVEVSLNIDCYNSMCKPNNYT